MKTDIHKYGQNGCVPERNPKVKITAVRLALIAFVILSVLYTEPLAGCDACGPSSNCNYVGVLPNIRKNFIGLRFNDRAFITKPYVELNTMSQETQDRYFSAELWGRYYVSRRLQFIGILPYAYHTRNEGGNISTIQGIGDAVLVTNYTLYASSDSIERKWTHYLQFAAGVKLPTGSYQHSSSGHVYHANFQIGSGSTDLMVNAIYTLRYKKVGLHTDFGYKYNTINADAYRFGDQISNSSNLFYWGSFGENNAIVPQLGIYQQYAFRDVSGGYYEPNTGGATTLLSLATELHYRQYFMGITYMVPFAQPQYEYPTYMQHSLRLNVSYFF